MLYDTRVYKVYQKFKMLRGRLAEQRQNDSVM
jgi:hypothetical protein